MFTIVAKRLITITLVSGFVVACASTTAMAQLEHLFSSVKSFTAGAAQNDDVTVLVVSYRGESTG